MKAMNRLYEAAVVLTVTYGSEIQVMNARDRNLEEAVEMRCWRFMRGITKYDRVKHESTGELTGVKIRLRERAEQATLRWYVMLREWRKADILL